MIRIKNAIIKCSYLTISRSWKSAPVMIKPAIINNFICKNFCVSCISSIRSFQQVILGLYRLITGWNQNFNTVRFAVFFFKLKIELSIFFFRKFNIRPSENIGIYKYPLTGDMGIARYR